MYAPQQIDGVLHQPDLVDPSPSSTPIREGLVTAATVHLRQEAGPALPGELGAEKGGSEIGVQDP